jgi:hypothetical protein
MESTLQKSAFVAARSSGKATTIIYWTVTALFWVQPGTWVTDQTGHMGDTYQRP